MSLGSTINLKVKHSSWGSLNSTPLQYSMVLSWIPDSDKSGMAVGMDPRPPVNRGWRWGWTPDLHTDPRQIGDGAAIPDPRQIGDGGGDGDRGFRALGTTTTLTLKLRHFSARREASTLYNMKKCDLSVLAACTGGHQARWAERMRRNLV